VAHEPLVATWGRSPRSAGAAPLASIALSPHRYSASLSQIAIYNEAVAPPQSKTGDKHRGLEAMIGPERMGWLPGSIYARSITKLERCLAGIGICCVSVRCTTAPHEVAGFAVVGG
jgi:hypothetical protein